MAPRKRRGPPPRDADGDPRNCQKLASNDSFSIASSSHSRQGQKQSLRARLYAFIRENPGATFRDVEQLPGCRGAYALKTSGGVILWSLSRAAGRAVLELLHEGMIEARDADPSDYEKPAYAETVAMVGRRRVKGWRLPLLPVVTNHRLWVPTPHWGPVRLHAVDAWSERADEARAQ